MDQYLQNVMNQLTEEARPIYDHIIERLGKEGLEGDEEKDRYAATLSLTIELYIGLVIDLIKKEGKPDEINEKYRSLTERFFNTIDQDIAKLEPDEEGFDKDASDVISFYLDQTGGKA